MKFETNQAREIRGSSAESGIMTGGETIGGDPVLARATRDGIVLHAVPGLRVTLLERPVSGIGEYRSHRFRTTHQIANPEAEELAMVLDIHPDARSAMFNRLLIEAFDGHRVREHVPTAIMTTEDETIIFDVHHDFGGAFLHCCMTEHAAAALCWTARALERDQIGTDEVMSMARDVAAARDEPFSDDDLVDVFTAVAEAAVGKRPAPSLAALAKLVDPLPERGRAKILAMVAHGELTLRRDEPRVTNPRRRPAPPRPAPRRARRRPVSATQAA